MKKKILVVVLLPLFLSPFLMANVQAGLLPFQSLRSSLRNNSSQDNSSQNNSLQDNSSQDNSSQRRPWLFGRNSTSQDSSDSQQTGLRQWLSSPRTGDEASLQWIRGQIDTVLAKLQQNGVTLPGDMNQKLNNFFATVSDYLTKSQSQDALLLPNLLKGPGYNLNLNYDPQTRVTDFIANRVLRSENSLTSIDLGGSFDPNGPWDMAFSIVNSISKRDKGSQRKGFFQRVLSFRNPSSADTSNTDISAASQSDTSKDTQQSDANSVQKTTHRSEFTFSGEICQDGLVFLYLNPSQTINLNFANSASYATQTGIEILQDAGSRAGKFYIDILDNSVSGSEDNEIFYREWPLW